MKPTGSQPFWHHSTEPSPAIWPAADWNCGHAKSSTGKALRRCGAAGVVPQASSNCSSARVFRKTFWPDRLSQKTMADTSVHHGDNSGKIKHIKTLGFASTVPLRLHQAQWIDSRTKMRGNCGMLPQLRVVAGGMAVQVEMDING